MKKFAVLLPVVLSTLSAAIAFADEAKPDNELSFNAAVTSDYRYRGISQTRLKPAVQGGLDYVNNPTGFYAGAWASTIKWIKDVDGDSNVELDLYAGVRGGDTVTYDVGVLRYQYVNNNMGQLDGFANANTTEVYGQLGFGPAYVKYSHSVTNLFGNINSKGSDYIDVGANIPMAETYTLNLHAGHQGVKNNDPYAYSDWKIGVTKDFGVVTGSIAAFGTNAEEGSYTIKDEFLGKNSLVLTVSKVF